MQKFAGVLAATAVMGAASLAYAANPTGAASATGRITGISVAKDSITLNNGSTFFAPPGTKFSNLRTGERVNVAYIRLGAVKDATKIALAAGSNAKPPRMTTATPVAR
jgi:Protein of unknown function (DUF1344)